MDKTSSDSPIATRILYDKDFLLQFQHLLPTTQEQTDIHHFVLNTDTYGSGIAATRPRQSRLPKAQTKDVPSMSTGATIPQSSRWLPKAAPSAIVLTEQAVPDSPPRQPVVSRQQTSPIFNISLEVKSDFASDPAPPPGFAPRPIAMAAEPSRISYESSDASKTTKATKLRTADPTKLRSPLASVGAQPKPASNANPAPTKLPATQPNPWSAKPSLVTRPPQQQAVTSLVNNKENRTAAPAGKPGLPAPKPVTKTTSLSEPSLATVKSSAPIAIKPSALPSAKAEEDDENDWDNPEVVERRLKSREKQIQYGYNTVGYKRYCEQIPKEKRTHGMPSSPDKLQRCSKRSWDGQVRKWRRELHEWDPEDVKKAWEEKSTPAANEIALDDAQATPMAFVTHRVERTLVF